MNSLNKSSAEVEQENNAQANNPDILESALTPKNVFENGSKEEFLEWTTFPRALAMDLNARQPDCSASIVFARLAFRTNNVPAYARKDGRQWFFKSLSGLVKEEFPYFTEDEVAGALKRLEKRSLIDVAESGTYGATQWFSVRTKARKQYEKAPSIWLRTRDAIAYGVRKATLLGNLSWQLEHWKEFVQDSAGNRYGKLSPSALTKPDPVHDTPALPLGRTTIIKLLQELCTTDKALTRHPQHSDHYTFTESMLPILPADALKTLPRPVQDHDSIVQVYDPPVQVYDSTVQVYGSETTPIARKALCTHDLESKRLEVNSNEHSNEDRNEHCKGNSHCAPVPASPSQEPSTSCKLSLGAKKLMELINAEIKVLGQREYLNGAPAQVHPHQLPYDDIQTLMNDLPYDESAIYIKNLITTRRQEIENAVEWIRNYWREFGIKYESKDVQRLTQFFAANPNLSLRHWQEIEYAIGMAQSDGAWSDRGWDNSQVLKRVRTAKARLHYLPQIISEMFESSDYDAGLDPDDLTFTGEVEAPFNTLDFTVLDSARGLKFQIARVPLKFVTMEKNPVGE